VKEKENRKDIVQFITYDQKQFPREPRNRKKLRPRKAPYLFHHGRKNEFTFPGRGLAWTFIEVGHKWADYSRVRAGGVRTNDPGPRLFRLLENNDMLAGGSTSLSIRHSAA